MKKQPPPISLALPLQPPVFTPLLRWLVFSLLAAFAPVLHAGVAAPLIDTPTAGSITSTTVTLGGNLTGDNGSVVLTRGVVYSKTTDSNDPFDGAANVTTLVDTGDPSVIQAFTLNATGLTPNTGYSFKAFATNANGITYTEVGTFTTSMPVVGSPTATTPTIVTTSDLLTGDVTYTASVTLGGNVTSDGGNTISQRGVVYSITADNASPAVGGAGVTKTAAATATTGVFTVDLTGLLSGVSYTYKAYVTNDGGNTYFYSASSTFTSATTKPWVVDAALDSRTANTATLIADISHDGGLALTERGLVYAITTTNANPTIGGTGSSRQYDAVDATGVISYDLEGLLPAKQYSYRFYAKNSKGTTYSNPLTFTTLADVPTVISPTKGSVGSTTVTLGGNVSKDNGSTVTQRGVVYSSTTATPTISNSRATASGTTGTFTVAVSSLTPGTTYYYRAYATNGIGTGYSSAGSFTTLAAKPSLVTAAEPSALGSTTATLGGAVSSANGSAVTVRGVVLSLTSINANPAIGGPGVSYQTTSGGTGSFAVGFTGLQPGKAYSYKAYATNAVGTTYGEPSTFTTDAAAPSVSTLTKSAIATTAATLGANVTADNGATVTARGIQVWNSGGTALVGSFAASAGGTGVFTIRATGLTIATAYRFRAYATNTEGTTYTTYGTFTTLAAKPTMAETPSEGTVGSFSAVIGGTITSKNGAAISEYGVLYSLNASPRLGMEGVLVKRRLTTLASPAPSEFPFEFEFTANRLKAGKTYYYRAYAKNSKGVAYSSVGTFETPPAAPSITSPTVAGIKIKSAILGATVSSANGAAITERGIVYSSTRETPAIGQSGVTKKTATGTTGVYTIPVRELTAETRYYFRAYATNSEGTTYSAARSFTTLPE